MFGASRKSPGLTAANKPAQSPSPLAGSYRKFMSRKGDKKIKSKARLRRKGYGGGGRSALKDTKGMESLTDRLRREKGMEMEKEGRKEKAQIHQEV